jgi:hypothetical protein
MTTVVMVAVIIDVTIKITAVAIVKSRKVIITAAIVILVS